MSAGIRFSDAVAGYVEAWFGGKHGAQQPYLLDARRLEEASVLNPLAEAFASEELLGAGGGTDASPLGVFTKAPALKPVGRQLKPALKEATAAQQTAGLTAIKESLASGYCIYMSDEPSALNLRVREEIHRSWIWNFVIHNFRTDGLRALGIDYERVEAIRQAGRASLVQRLYAGGLMRRPKKRIGMVGALYGEAGALMRFAQTSEEIERLRFLEHTPALDRWPYRRYVRD
jgi:hypothetical protein